MIPLNIFRLPGHEKPAAANGGPPDPKGSNHVEKDTTNMTAIPLFNKTVPASGQQLAAWLRRGRTEVFSVTTMLTPELALDLLSRNDANRAVSSSSSGVRSVPAYSDMMRRGEWKLNGSTIVVSRTGELNDGQHRCYANIEAGVAVPVHIVFGVDRDSRSTLDQGRARSPGDILTMEGETNTNHFAVYLQFRTVIADNRAYNDRLTPDEVLTARDRFPGFHGYHSVIGGYAKRMGLSHGYLAGAHGLCFEASPAVAETFAEAVSTGVGISSVNSPVARLRRIYEDSRLKRSPLPRIRVAALYVKAFNNFSRGRTGAIAWREKDLNEAFPMAVRG